ncbi:MAG: hypothetical protein GX417_09735 [Clostridiales bacterium]|nr:hypothetical protein [Clostridiales bacterium]
MQDIDYQKISCAITFTKPKTTALLYDRLWMPASAKNSKLINNVDIPEKVRIDGMDSEILLSNPDKNSALKSGYPFDVIADIFSTKTGKMENDHANKDFVLDYITLFYATYLQQNFYSKVTPILSSRANVEWMVLPNTRTQIKNIDKLGDIHISDIPIIVEDSLEWEQVLDMRKDKRTLYKLRRFSNWCELELSKKDTNNVEATLYKALEDYKFALKKHGILTATGSLSLLLSATSSILSAVLHGNSILPEYLTITAGLITFTVNELVNFKGVKREPIAIFHEILKK